VTPGDLKEDGKADIVVVNSEDDDAMVILSR
jgi:hypothetical protein